MLRSAVFAANCLRTAPAALSSLQFVPSVIIALQPQAQPLSGLQQLHHIHNSSSSSTPQQQAEPDVQRLQQQLLDAALQHVKRLGWTRSSLAAAAADLQLSPAAVGMFPRGPSQLAEHFVAQQNAELERELQAAQQQYLELPLRQRIAAAVRRRLELNAQHMDSWPQALALLSQPSNAPAALKLLTSLLDTIWYAAGDTATDASWYTKRAALASIYLSTELYMLTDYSPGYADTWQQLERRIDDALWLGSAAQGAAALPQLLLQALAQAHQAGGPQQGAAAGTAGGVGAAQQGAPSAAAQWADGAPGPTNSSSAGGPAAAAAAAAAGDASGSMAVTSGGAGSIQATSS